MKETIVYQIWLWIPWILIISLLLTRNGVGPILCYHERFKWIFFSPVFKIAYHCLMYNTQVTSITIPTARNRNGILLPKLFWPTVRKNCPWDREKRFWDHKNNLFKQWKVRTIFGNGMLVLKVSHIKFEIRGWRPRICKNFEITRTICLNSERSEQFLVTECLSWRFLIPDI